MEHFDAEWISKLEELREAGVDPYPNGLVVSHTSTELHAAWPDASVEPEGDSWANVSVGGRLMFRNRMGKAMFLRLQDRGEPTVTAKNKDGEEETRGGVIQVYLRREGVGEEAFAKIKRLDVGDIVWAQGRLMRTRTGELTVQAEQVVLASKILNSFPDRWHGLADVQTRSRQRYVDLFMNEEARSTFRLRSRMVSAIRRFFEAHEYLEVETPMMHPIPGGASAKPFVTHHNTLGLDLYLRVAPELYLKRLIVGGLERVFEINRSFRNEGVSTKHNPEFTMLEFYQAWATHEDLMVLIESLLGGLLDELVGSRKVTFGDFEIDFSTPFRRADMDELIAEKTGMSREELGEPETMEKWWRANHSVGDADGLPQTRGEWWEWLFDAHVEKSLINPTFVTGYPTEISPLSRRNEEDPSRVDRFELFAGAFEVVNAFSELNDPIDQAERFERQVEAHGSEEAGLHIDRDYLRALSYAMPPTAGAGLGIDRLVMLLSGKTSIREVILFPTLRPESDGQE